MASRDAGGSSGVDDSSVELDALAIVSELNRHGVEYVVIGAFAAIVQPAPIALRVLPALYRYRASRQRP